MQLRVGCEFQYDSPTPTPAVVLVEPHPTPPHHVLRERWDTEPAAERHGYQDLFSNRLQRLVLPAGASVLRYDALIDVSPDPDPISASAQQAPVEELPDNVLVFTLASRYCLSDSLSQVAWHLFGGSQPGWSRVQAICDWLHVNIRYGLLHSTPLTTAVDVYVAGGGMCRDFAHLAITFCRAMNIPARYVFGYMPDIGVTGPQPPMDFHAWFEAYLDDRWWTFDARFNRPRIGRVPIGIGRDAVDVAMVTTYGSAIFKRMTVWTDEAETIDGVQDHEAPSVHAPSRSEALVLNSGQRREENGPA